MKTAAAAGAAGDDFDGFVDAVTDEGEDVRTGVL
jgi:hypothetical protein